MVPSWGWKLGWGAEEEEVIGDVAVKSIVYPRSLPPSLSLSLCLLAAVREAPLLGQGFPTTNCLTLGPKPLGRAIADQSL